MAPKVPFFGLETETLHLINSMTMTDFGLIGVAASMLVQCLSWTQRCDSRKVVLPASAMTRRFPRGFDGAPLPGKPVTTGDVSPKRDSHYGLRASARHGADRL